jgi:hypothetical protein
MNAAKRTPAEWALREKLAELGHVLAIVSALVEGAVAIGAQGGDARRALVTLRLLAVEASSAAAECKDLHRAVVAIVNGEDGGSHG